MHDVKRHASCVSLCFPHGFHHHSSTVHILFAHLIRFPNIPQAQQAPQNQDAMAQMMMQQLQNALAGANAAAQGNAPAAAPQAAPTQGITSWVAVNLIAGRPEA